MALQVIVLAAGAGTRMRSRLPKALHRLAGRPLLAHVLDAAATQRPHKTVVVVGEQAEQVRAGVAEAPAGAGEISWALQAPRLGTGHAVSTALPQIAADATVLVLLGDVPLVGADTLAACVERARSGVAIVTADLSGPDLSGPGLLGPGAPAPDGLGARVLRDGERVVGIVEEKDATAAERAIGEVNSGMLAAPCELLRELLRAVTPNNAQGEYYLTDVVGLAAARGVEVSAVRAERPEEILGVNDRAQLAHLERHHQRRQAQALMAAGVTVMDPARLDVRGTVRAGQDCVIDVGVVLEGEVALGEGVVIGAGCVLRDVALGDGVEVLPMSCIDGARVAAGCRIGPFARLRPGTDLGPNVHIGNFVETKKARLGAGAKANHLAYLGDATVGADCNIGAGTITCNYDGAAKHRTEIGERVFVGTNATLVAPLTIEDEAYVGAGSTITTKVERADLAVGRGRQRNIKGWTPPAKRT